MQSSLNSLGKSKDKTDKWGRWGKSRKEQERGIASMLSALGSKQNGVIVDGDVVRVFLATDTLPHAVAGDCIPRFHRQVSRCT